MAAAADLVAPEACFPGGFAAAEEVVVAVPVVAGPGQPPARVHAQVHPGAVLGAAALNTERNYYSDYMLLDPLLY